MIPLGIFVSWQSSRHVARTAGRIDDLSVSAEDVLRSIAAAEDVQVLVSPASPTQRIIHIADAHYVDPDEFKEAANAAAARRGLTVGDIEIAACHEKYIDDIARLQDAQFALLCALVDLHGLRHLFRESLSDDDLPLFQDAVEQYRTIGPKRDETRREIEQITGEIEQQDQDRKTRAYLNSRRRFLQAELAVAMNLGAACDLVIARPFVRVLPAEDEQAYEKAGRELNVLPDGPAQATREAAIVRRLLAHKPCSVVLLGRGHDLSREIEKQSGGSCEYIKVVPREFPGPPLEPLFARGDHAASTTVDHLDVGATNNSIFQWCLEGGLERSVVGFQPSQRNRFRHKSLWNRHWWGLYSLAPRAAPSARSRLTGD